MFLLLLIAIFVQFNTIQGYVVELSCPEDKYEMRSKAYLKLDGDNARFCISCLFLFGGFPVSKQTVIHYSILFIANYYY